MSAAQLQDARTEATKALGINHLSFVTFPPLFFGSHVGKVVDLSDN